MNTSREKLLERAKKLLELSKKGIDGEKNNAEMFLSAFLSKHKIDINEIDDDQIHSRYFFFRNDLEEVLLTQITKFVLNISEFMVFRNKKVRRKHSVLKLRDIDFVEIEMLFEFYKPLLQDEFEKITIAFCLANRLYSVNVDEKDDSETKPQSPEERARIKQILAFSQSIGSKTPRKQLKRG